MRTYHKGSQKQKVHEDSLHGILPVYHALLAGRRQLRKLLLKGGKNTSGRIDELVNLAKKKKVPIEVAPKNYFDDLGGNSPHQGVALQCGPFQYADSGYLKKILQEQETPLFVALDQIEDPHNIGAILRSCGFFSVAGVIVCEKHFPGITATVSKVSAGIAEQMAVIRVKNLSRFLVEQKQNNYWPIGFEMTASQSLYEMKRDRPLILVVGNEGSGVRPLVQEQCDWLVHIPGSTDVESLNVSNATAIGLYQLSKPT